MAQSRQMSEMMLTFTADKFNKKEHLANARFDERKFRRIKEFSDKREDWREWRMHFTSAVRECDTTFADYLWTIEKKLDEEVDIVNLSHTYTQLSAALYSRLIDVTSK